MESGKFTQGAGPWAVRDCYVYLVIMYSMHVELAASPVNAGHLVRTVSLCYT